MNLDIRVYNRAAWDRQVEMGNPWTRPVTSAQIAAARRGEWSVVLTENRPVPPAWFPPLAGRAVLCLASGGGQQAPILAAAGARVTVLDNSPRQLARDREVAERDGLGLTTVLGDMADLSAFADQSFDLVFHPVSNVFCPQVRPVWREAFRVLRPGGRLLAGFANPVYYLFGTIWEEQKELRVRHAIPYSDLESLSAEEIQTYMEQGTPFEYGHSLTDLLGGQTDAGFQITGLYEDDCPDSPVSQYHPTYIATRALRP
jgi:SAM-dependent methyltransferase